MLHGNKVTLVQQYSTSAIDIGPWETYSKIIRFLAELPAHTAKRYVMTLTSASNWQDNQLPDHPGCSLVYGKHNMNW